MPNEPSYDQTKFSQDRPMYEEEVSRPIPESKLQDVNQNKGNKPWYKRKKILAVIGFVAFLVMLLIFYVAANQQKEVQPEEILEVEEQMQENNGPFLRRINQLNTELKAADPTKPSLIFPPVNMEIRLDDEE